MNQNPILTAHCEDALRHCATDLQSKCHYDVMPPVRRVVDPSLYACIIPLQQLKKGGLIGVSEMTAEFSASLSNLLRSEQCKWHKGISGLADKRGKKCSRMVFSRGIAMKNTHFAFFTVLILKRVTRPHKLLISWMLKYNRLESLSFD